MNAQQDYINNLINERGYAEAPQEIRDAIYKDLEMRLNKFIITQTISALSPEDLATFEKMLDEGKSVEELKKFAADHIKDYTSFLTSRLLLFKDAYLA